MSLFQLYLTRQQTRSSHVYFDNGAPIGWPQGRPGGAPSSPAPITANTTRPTRKPIQHGTARQWATRHAAGQHDTDRHGPPLIFGEIYSARTFRWLHPNPLVTTHHSKYCPGPLCHVYFDNGAPVGWPQGRHRGALSSQGGVDTNGGKESASSAPRPGSPRKYLRYIWLCATEGWPKGALGRA